MRSLYRLLLRLHPAGFRDRFSSEMLAIFDQFAEGRRWLLAEAMVSLMRQWVLRPRRQEAAAASGPGLALTAVDVPGSFPLAFLRGLAPALVLLLIMAAALRQPKTASLFDAYFEKARTLVQTHRAEPAESSESAAARPPMTRADDITQALLAAFGRHDVVALGEWHSTKEDSDIRINLIRAPAFAASVRSVVFECASAFHQETLDRFTAGGDVPERELRNVWRDVMTPGACMAPVYEQFLRQVRSINRGRGPEQRVRVLAGSPPIDWNRASADEVRGFVSHLDSFPAELVSGVLARGEKALIVFGAGHLWRHTKLDATLIARLDQKFARRVYTVHRIHGAGPGFAPLDSSSLGKLPANAYLGRGIPFPLFASSTTLAQAADAVIVTKEDTVVDPPKADAAWAAEIERRLKLRRGK